jgi:BirA family biotin operon repressor/biotin-[acetyl-CoA-carboxylase] ligase
MPMRKVIRLETASSTQDEAFAQAEQGAEDGTVILALEQTAGRGRLRREWVSPKGAGAYLSLVCRPRDPSDFTCLPFAAGIAAARAIARLTSLEPKLKWPNDVLIEGKKAGGILVESRTTGPEMIAAVGVGINLTANENPFICDSPHAATALDQHTLAVPDPATLAEAFAAEFDQARGRGLESILKDWEKLDSTIGSQVEVVMGDRKMAGVAKGLDPTGALVVETPDGDFESILAGDVSIAVRR